MVVWERYLTKNQEFSFYRRKVELDTGDNLQFLYMYFFI